MMKILTGSFSYSPVARHYTVFKGKINESPEGGAVIAKVTGMNRSPDGLGKWRERIQGAGLQDQSGVIFSNIRKSNLTYAVTVEYLAGLSPVRGVVRSSR